MQLLGFPGWLLWHCFAKWLLGCLLKSKESRPMPLIFWCELNTKGAYLDQTTNTKNGACLIKLIILPLIKSLK